MAFNWLVAVLPGSLFENGQEIFENILLQLYYCKEISILILAD